MPGFRWRRRGRIWSGGRWWWRLTGAGCWRGGGRWRRVGGGGGWGRGRRGGGRWGPRPRAGGGGWVGAVALRSRVVGERLAGRGAMVSVALAAGRVEELIGPYGGRVSVAAVNGPAAVVVSGDPGVLEELLAGWERDGVRARRVPVDYASHSVQVEAVRDELLQVLAPVAPRPGRGPFYSASQGGFTGTGRLGAGAWYRDRGGRAG